MRPMKIRPLDEEVPWRMFSATNLGDPSIAWVKMGTESDCLNPIDARNVEIIVNLGWRSQRSLG
jgi:hypothetical protein